MMEYKNTRDPEALTELFRRYRRPLYRFLARRTGSASRAEDLAQDVFAALIAAARRYEPTGSFKAYLYRIARNLSAKEWRTYRRRRQLNGEPVNPSGTEQQVEAQRTARAVRRALDTLDADQRDAIVLREYQGLSYAEIGEVLGVPTGTVKSRIARGKLTLRKLLVTESG
jgi:RNA polymerase sigma-70 factor (ECF subfamily)